LEQSIVLGIDGGGTYTRAVAADLKGNVLAFSKKQGAHPKKNKDPEKNVKEAIEEVLQLANCSAASIRCIVGGFAGLNEPADQPRFEKYLQLPGIQCSKVLVNDAQVAQYGAFLGKPGILAVAGTGSIVFGKTEEGLNIKSYDFHYDSEAGSRYLSFWAIFEIISKRTSAEDHALVQLVNHYWGVKTIEELRMLSSKGFSDDKIGALQKLSAMGAIVTGEAAKGSPIAIRACKKAIDSLLTGVELVGSMFSSEVVPIALVGGVITNPFMEKMFKQELNSVHSLKKYSFEPVQLSPVMGAILHAYSQLGIQIDDCLVAKLVEASKGRFV
jgi:glucosamine kinase